MTQSVLVSNGCLWTTSGRRMLSEMDRLPVHKHTVIVVSYPWSWVSQRGPLLDVIKHWLLLVSALQLECRVLQHLTEREMRNWVWICLKRNVVILSCQFENELVNIHCAYIPNRYNIVRVYAQYLMGLLSWACLLMGGVNVVKCVVSVVGMFVGTWCVWSAAVSTVVAHGVNPLLFI